MTRLTRTLPAVLAVAVLTPTAAATAATTTSTPTPTVQPAAGVPAQGIIMSDGRICNPRWGC